MSNQKKKEEEGFAEELLGSLLPPKEPKNSLSLSVILPVYNCADVIGRTLESLQLQGYFPLEVLVIDAGSTDRSLEIIHSYSGLISRVYTVERFDNALMINRGIALAKGTYITILYPGSFYLSSLVFASFLTEALGNTLPDLIYCGGIQREVHRPPRTIYLPIQDRLLVKGIHPATLPACWFHRDLFDRIGRFDSAYPLRLGYEFFCRVSKEKNLNILQVDRVFVDFDYGRFSYGKILRFAADTWLIILRHYGLIKAISWFIGINHLLIVKGIWRLFKRTLYR